MASTETKRLFVAFDLSIDVVNALVEARAPLDAKLREGDRRWRPVSPERIHLTLKFLGDTPTALIPRLEEALVEVCDPLFAFDIKVCDVGAFPSAKSPRILWAGVDDESAEVLGLLHRNINQELWERLGIEEERRDFKPHITLGRLGGEAPEATEWVDEMEGRVFGRTSIRDMALFSSTLGAQGPTYRVLRRFALGRK